MGSNKSHSSFNDSQIELLSNKQELEVVEPDSSADENISRSHDHDSSEIFDTDSSEDNQERDDDDLLHQVVQIEEEPPEETKVEEETQREEMGGILVYDAYAKMFGCEKIE